MTAAFATLFVLATLWMLVVVGAAMLETRVARILAALKGEIAEPILRTRPVRIRHQRFQGPRATRISVGQRAAA